MTPYHAYRRTFISARWRILQYTKEHAVVRQRRDETGTITCSEGVWECVTVNAATVLIVTACGDAETAHKSSACRISYPLCFQHTAVAKMYILFPAVELGDCRYAHMSLWGNMTELSSFLGSTERIKPSSPLPAAARTHTHAHTRYLKAWLAWLAMGRNRLWLLIAAWRWICVCVYLCVRTKDGD